MKAGYMVKELLYDDFIDLKALASNLIENRNKDSTGKTVRCLKIKRLRFEKAKPNVIFYSYTAVPWVMSTVNYMLMKKLLEDLEVLTSISFTTVSYHYLRQKRRTFSSSAKVESFRKNTISGFHLENPARLTKMKLRNPP